MVKRMGYLALSLILLVSLILAGCTSKAPAGEQTTGEQTEQPSEQNENTPSQPEGSESEEASEESPDPFGNIRNP